MSNPLNSLITFIKAQLEKRNWSERDLARTAQLTPAAVNGALKGEKDIRLSTIVSMATGLEVEPFYLLMTPSERAKWGAKAESGLAERVAALEAKASAKPANPSDELSQLVAQLPPDEYRDLLNYIRLRQSPSARKKGTGQS